MKRSNRKGKKGERKTEKKNCKTREVKAKPSKGGNQNRESRCKGTFGFTTQKGDQADVEKRPHRREGEV